MNRPEIVGRAHPAGLRLDLARRDVGLGRRPRATARATASEVTRRGYSRFHSGIGMTGSQRGQRKHGGGWTLSPPFDLRGSPCAFARSPLCPLPLCRHCCSPDARHPAPERRPDAERDRDRRGGPLRVGRTVRVDLRRHHRRPATSGSEATAGVHGAARDHRAPSARSSSRATATRSRRVTSSSTAPSIFDATTGELIQSGGYDTAILPVAVTVGSGADQFFGCATEGSRIVMAVPGSDQAAASV